MSRLAEGCYLRDKLASALDLDTLCLNGHKKGWPVPIVRNAQFQLKPQSRNGALIGATNFLVCDTNETTNYLEAHTIAPPPSLPLVLLLYV